jgi:hypothetical protein
MSRCKHTSRVVNVPIAAGGTKDVSLGVQTVEYAARVVDAAGNPIAFTFAYTSLPHALFHFAAGEAWAEERIGPLAAALSIQFGSAIAGVVELVIWED